MSEQRVDQAWGALLHSVLRALSALSSGSPVPELDTRAPTADARETMEAIADQLDFLEREMNRMTMDTTLLEQTQVELQEQLAVIEHQSEVIRALQAPVLELWDGILCVPIVGAIDDEHGAQLGQVVLDAVATRKARCVILDITGVEDVEATTASRLLQTAAAVRLLGAECMVSGVSPVVAQRMLALGSDLGGITTCRSLRDALLQRLARAKAR